MGEILTSLVRKKWIDTQLSRMSALLPLSPSDCSLSEAWRKRIGKSGENSFGALLARPQFSPAAPAFFRCRGGRAWHSFPRVRGNEWSEREGWRKHAFGMFSSSLRSDRPSAAPKALSGFCRTSDLVLAEEIGRRERIRTSGPYVPNVVLYQAELLSDPVRKECPLASGGALITMPPRPRNRTASPSGRGPFPRFAERPGSLYTKAPVQGSQA
jgi:hypothetical protein